MPQPPTCPPSCWAEVTTKSNVGAVLIIAALCKLAFKWKVLNYIFPTKVTEEKCLLPLF